MERLHGAYIYARYSTEHQNSIEEQVDACTQACAARGLPVLNIYPDAAVSGTKLSRCSFDRMMADLRTGLADTVVIYDQSRLMRSVEGWFSARAELQSLGVGIISATQANVGGDIRQPTNFLLESVQATFDQLHVLITREKVTHQMHYMARNGEHTGGKPALGYRVEQGQDGKKRLAVEPQEAETVRRIFAEYAGGRSYREIIQSLNRDGVRTKRGNAFGTNSLHDLLKNRLYIGQRIYGARSYRPDGTRNTHRPEGQDVVELELPELAIVDKSIFEQVQAKMTQNKHQNAGRPASAREYPLKGKVFCGECGSAMAVAASKPKNGQVYHYYRCPRKNRTHDCESRPIRCDTLEQLVVDNVRAAIGNPDIRQAAFRRMMSISPARAEDAKRKRLLKQRDEAQRKLDNALDALLDLGSLPELRQRISTLKAEIAELTAEIKRIAAVSTTLSALTPAEMEKVYQRLCTEALTNPAAVLAIVSRVEIYNTEIRIFTIFTPDPPKGIPESRNEEFIKIDGIPSGVPAIYISPAGILMISARRNG